MTLDGRPIGPTIPFRDAAIDAAICVLEALRAG